MAFPAKQASRWHLKPLGTLGLPAAIEVGPQGLGLGRDPSNAVALAGDGFGSISAHHARVELRGDRLHVVDLGSSNGTLVNGRRIDDADVPSGSLIQLGEGGPRFVAVHYSGLEQTSMVPAAPSDRPADASLGQTAVHNLRRALGIDPEAAHQRMRSNRRLTLAILAFVLALSGAGAWAWFKNQRQRSETDEHIERQTARIEELNRSLAQELEQRLAQAGQKLESEIGIWNSARDAWEGQRSDLSRQRQDLLDQIRRLEEEGHTSSAELAILRSQLEQTTTSLADFDPVNLEQIRLRDVRRVRETVVLIETTVVFRDGESGAPVSMGFDEHGDPELSLEGVGEPLERRSTGSGFCFTPEGWILTNAHVVQPPEFDPILLDRDHTIVPDVKLNVVFSGTDRRYPAELLEIANECEDDMALIAIEPFEGMPYLRDFTPDVAIPEPGTEVYLFGFPLGTFAVQEGDRVIASTLKGILSRQVGPYLQVDAGVHPGISGGPATDSRGRVLGLVTSVQATPMGGLAAVIGYVLPIVGASKVLPRAAESEQ
jgi:S1-C subfamily serine protease